MAKKLRVAVIGSGLQAKRRLNSFVDREDSEAVSLAGRREVTTKQLAEEHGVEMSLDWKRTISRNDIDAVMICTPPNTHFEMATEAMKRGKHVLCEKPLAMSTKEAEEMIRVSRKNSVVLKCGFNHRFHPGIRKAKEWLDNGSIGNSYFIRARYGHGGRPGYESQWRSKSGLVSGGQLMEHGIHAIDLFRMFFGGFDTAVGFVSTNYWPIAPLEDNAFALFRSDSGKVAFLHSSLTQWRNLFSFEIGGENGMITVEGLGGSYGVEKAILNPREFNKPFREEVIEFRGEDKSWNLELDDFVRSITKGEEPNGNGKDGLEGLKMIFAVYESAKRSQPVEISKI